MPSPFERVKAAWESPNRQAELNRSVEVMATEGVTLNELDAALGELLEEVRSAGADEETEEIIMGVGDRLHGWCEPMSQIQVMPVKSASSRTRSDDYAGREQSQVKHYILRHYLERFAHIIGFKWNTLTYVDCFSGPWQSNAPDLSDTSFAIALQELRKARETHAVRKSLNIRCMFLEENPARHAELKKYADRQTDVTVTTRNAALLDSIPEIVRFIREGGRDSFPFIFIDPTGWTGYDLDRIRPLLQQKPGEVLINFMTEHIRRWIDDERPEIQESFRRCFGKNKDDVFARLRAVYGDNFRQEVPQEVEDELFSFYARQVREAGQYPYSCPAVVLHPTKDRTYFHLIYATRHRKGVEVFKQVEKDAFFFQEEVRTAAKEAERVRKTKQPSLFLDEEAKTRHCVL